MKMNNKMLNEEFLNEDIASIVTGEEVANLLGVGALYKKGKEEIARDENMRENIKSKFADLTERMNKAPKGIECNFD